MVKAGVCANGEARVRLTRSDWIRVGVSLVSVSIIIIGAVLGAWNSLANQVGELSKQGAVNHEQVTGRINGLDERTSSNTRRIERLEDGRVSTLKN